MKKTLALILACCLITGCSSVSEKYDDSSRNSQTTYSSTHEQSTAPNDTESSVNPPEKTQNSSDSSSLSSSSSSTTQSVNSSSQSSSSKPQSVPGSSKSSSKKPQSVPNSSKSSSKKPQSVPDSSKSSSSKPQSTPSSPQIIGSYERRAPETWELEYADEVFRLVNAERVKNGLPEFKKMPQLTESATVRAWEILVDYGHERPDGKNFSTALTEQGIKFSVSGENIAAGQKDPQSVVNAWMNSSGHRANILSEEFEYLGVGFYYDNDGIGGTYRRFWVQNFCSVR